MDSILSYCESSSHDEEDEDGNCSTAAISTDIIIGDQLKTETPSLSKQDRCIDYNSTEDSISRSVPSEKTSMDSVSDTLGVGSSDSSALTADYFGLADQSGSDSEEELVPPQAMTVDKGAEVPGSAYWKDFNPDVKSRYDDSFSKSPVCDIPVEKSSKPVKFVSRGFLNHDDSVKACGRKVFFVHHQISENLHRDCHSKPKNQVLKLAAHTGIVNCVRWCRRRDFSHLAATCSSDGKVKLWNLFTQGEYYLGAVYEHDKAVSSVSWSSSGRNLLSASYDRSAVITDVETSQPVSTFRHQNHVTRVGYNPDDHRLIMSISKDLIYSWDLRTTAKPVRLLRHPRKEVTTFFDFSYINESREIAVSTDSCEHNLCVFDVKSGALVSIEQEMFPERYTCPRLLSSQWNKCFLAQTQGNYICEFNQKRPYKLNKYKRFQGHIVSGYPIGFDITCDCKTILSGSTDGKLYLYDWWSGKNVSCVSTDLGVCVDVTCHPVMGNVVLAGSWDGQIALVK